MKIAPLFTLVCALFYVFASHPVSAETRTERPPLLKPNILLIMVDDLGKEWVSCYGSNSIETVHIDQLAREGMRFNNAYSMPQCTPTRATLLTGQYPWRHGWVNHWDVPRWGNGCHFDWKHNTTFARVLKQAGYVTAAAGKWQINDFRVTPDAMTRHGFDDYCMWTGYETNNPPSEERYANAYIHTREGSRAYTDQFGPDVFTDFLIDFIHNHRDKPMLLYYPMVLTHVPFTATPLAPEAKSNLDKHKAMVRYVDHLTGRLVKALEETGVRERTLIIFTTDNGSAPSITGELNHHKVKGGKATLFESGMAEPFIASWPGVTPANVTTDALTDFTDILPTFADLAGAALPAGTTIDGISIADVIRGEKSDSPREWIMSMGFGPAAFREGRVVPKKKQADRVIRNKRYKLWIENEKPSRLFDLKHDPWEQHNLIDSADKTHVDAFAKLTRIAATFPHKDAAPHYDPTPAQPWDQNPTKARRE